MKKSKTMKRKQRGGENTTMVPVAVNTTTANTTTANTTTANLNKNKGLLNKAANAVSDVTGMFGGKKSGKKTRKASSWAKAVGKLYHAMQRKDKKTTFVQALKEASRLKKAGKFDY